MGTRGLYGFVVDGVAKASYNHFDSYPENLGESVVRFLVENDIDAIKEFAKKIKLVNQGEIVDEEFLRENGFDEDEDYSKHDYYDALRDYQGELDKIFQDNMTLMTDDISFIKDSLFCEWAYLINFDTEELEVYKGFQKSPPKNNRWFDPNETREVIDSNEYFPCEMITAIPFEDLKEGSFHEYIYSIVKDEE